MLFGGVEGGATHSTLALFNDKAEKLAEVEGLGTNLFQIGMEETCHRIANMCQDAFKLAGYAPDTPLVSLGLSLSGCEVEETNEALALKMKELYPALLKTIPKVCSDTVGSLFTASDKGGVVLIAGTGSNSLLVNPDGSVGRCGGWGHFLGDDGSALWIAHKACKVYFDQTDNLNESPASVDRVKELIFEHFNLEDRLDIIM